MKARSAATIFGPAIAAMLMVQPAKEPPAAPPAKIEQAAPKAKTTTKRVKPTRSQVHEQVAPGKAKLKPKKQQGKATGSPPGAPQAASGPGLPWPCWLVKAHAAGKTEKQLRAEGKKHGIKLTPKQRAQAAACLNS